jgi:hypothetical protein
MGFQQRERKRRRKAYAARERAAKESRRNRSSRRNWWLTPATQPSRCSNPDCLFPNRPKGSEIVYRAFGPGVSIVLCVRCADRQGIEYKLSRKWQAKRAKEYVRNRTRPQADPPPATLRYECPLCGGAHPKAECAA